MWPASKPQLHRPPSDLDFLEVVHKRMQIPSRLKVVVDPGAAAADTGLPGDCPLSFRMYVPDRLFLAEIMDVPFSPQLVYNQPPLESAAHPGTGQAPAFLSCASQVGSQKHKWQAHQSGSWKGRAGQEGLQAARQGAGQRQDWSPERGLAWQGPLEDSGGSDLLAMRKQLGRISRRLRSLEEQQMRWRQKEALVYAALVSTSLLNVWLWMRR